VIEISEDISFLVGPLDLLNHAHVHLKNLTEFDNRIALISVDNAIELLIKIFFKKNEDIIPEPNEYKKIVKNFPKMVRSLELFFEGKIFIDEINAILTYHKIRTRLSTRWDAIELKKEDIASYMALGITLISRLFNIKKSTLESRLEHWKQDLPSLLGSFLLDSGYIDHSLELTAEDEKYGELKDRRIEAKSALEFLLSINVLNEKDEEIIRKIKDVRKDIIEDGKIPSLQELKQFTKELSQILNVLTELIPIPPPPVYDIVDPEFDIFDLDEDGNFNL
jgi:hypothetical protein